MRCLYTGLLFAALSIGLCIGFSNNASAASAYDDFDPSVKKLMYKGGCDVPTDFSTSWRDGFNNNKQNRDYHGDLKDKFDTAVSSGNGGWSVTSTSSYIYLSFVEDASHWHNEYIGTAPNRIIATVRNDGVSTSERIHVIYLYAGDDCKLYMQQATSNSSIATEHNFVIGTESGEIKELFLSTFDTIYPENYEGSEIPGTYDPNPTIQPEIKYSVKDKSIVASEELQKLPTYTPPDPDNYFKGYSIQWYVRKCSSFKSTVCKDGTEKDNQIQKRKLKYEFDVDDYGEYTLGAEYVATECHDYKDGISPDYCFVIPLGPRFPDVDFVSTTVYLDIDGSNFSGSTANMECDVSGYCKTPDDGLGMFRGLDSINTGGLQSFFLAPINFYATLPEMTQSCTPIEAPLLGKTMTLECIKPKLQTWSPFIMTMWQTVLTAVVAYAIARSVFFTIKDINSPDKDGIEVTKL